MTLGSVLTPVILEREIKDDSAVINFIVPNDLAYLDGHFPETPVVPGVVQVHWASKYAMDIFGVSSAIEGGSQIKFSNLMLPEETVTLELTHSLEKQTISFRYFGAEKPYSSGRLQYA